MSLVFAYTQAHESGSQEDWEIARPWPPSDWPPRHRPAAVVSPERLACVSACGALGLGAIVLVVVLLALYVRACRASQN